MLTPHFCLLSALFFLLLSVAVWSLCAISSPLSHTPSFPSSAPGFLSSLLLAVFFLFSCRNQTAPFKDCVKRRNRLRLVADPGSGRQHRKPRWYPKAGQHGPVWSFPPVLLAVTPRSPDGARKSLWPRDTKTELI